MTSAERSAVAQVLHLDLVLLKEDVPEEARQALFEEAGSLRDLPGVLAIGVIDSVGDSDFNLAFFFVLDGLASLESFGAHERYIAFLQGGLARSLRSFAGADVQVMAPFGGVEGYAGCVALAATPQTYDWQVRTALNGWAASGEHPLIGLAVGERQRYRGIGIMFSAQPVTRPASGFEGFGIEFISGRARLLS